MGGRYSCVFICANSNVPGIEAQKQSTLPIVQQYQGARPVLLNSWLLAECPDGGKHRMPSRGP